MIFRLGPAGLALACTLCAQNVPQLLSTISGTTQYREAQVSPDGHWLAWTVALRNPDNTPSSDSEIWLLDLTRPGASPKRLHDGRSRAEHSVAFSPDSRRIAFLSDLDRNGQLELYVEPVGGRGAKRLTNLTGYLSDPRWSPGGKTIALLYTENAPRAAGPLEPSTKDAGVVEDRIYEQRLTLVDAQSGESKPITPPDTYVYEYDWSPAGGRIAYTASKGNGDNNWWIAQLFTVAAASGEIRLIDKPELQIAMPRWSPDGSRIAYIGGIMSDEGSTGGDIYAVSSQGGAPADLTPGRKSSPSWLRWMKSGSILFTETVDGGTAIATLDPKTGVAETLWRGDETLRAGEDVVSMSDDAKTLAAIRTSWTLAPEVWAGPRGEWTRRTHANDSLKPLWGKAENLHWTSGGAAVQGWLLYPRDFDSSRKYPMVVSVHGGPAAAKRPSWPAGHFDMSVLSSQGYFVLFPNPRGSYGAGEAFTHANVKDFGYGDLRDIDAGVDEALAKLPVDPNRIGIAGWSYGGFMTMWTVTQTTRFHAAVAGAGIANWQSYYGENLIDRWMIPYFGASVYDDPAVYAKSSPITYIKNVKTPTLILVGDSDAECPAPQSYEFWHALKTLGVKTQLVVYPGEGHAIRKPEHQKDILERTIAWFNRNLQ
ncbi:MAG: S9 family peptidase [Acidobacteriota bacterium]|nr:S9 family peptidase [Acidobacteriota bacterium]